MTYQGALLLVEIGVLHFPLHPYTLTSPTRQGSLPVSS